MKTREEKRKKEEEDEREKRNERKIIAEQLQLLPLLYYECNLYK